MAFDGAQHFDGLPLTVSNWLGIVISGDFYFFVFIVYSDTSNKYLPIFYFVKRNYKSNIMMNHFHKLSYGVLIFPSKFIICASIYALVGLKLKSVSLVMFCNYPALATCVYIRDNIGYSFPYMTHFAKVCQNLHSQDHLHLF